MIKSGEISSLKLDELPWKFPTRSELCDTKKNLYITYENKDGIAFLPVSIHETNSYDRNHRELKYTIILFGIVLNGEKTAVILRDIFPHFDIRVPNGKDVSNFMNTIKHTLINLINELDKFEYRNIEIIKGFPLHQFQIEKINYIRISFYKNKCRTDAINYFRKNLNYEILSDDWNYFPKVARDYRFNTGSWNFLPRNKLKVEKLNDYYLVNLSYCYSISIYDFKPINEDIIGNNYVDLLKPKIMILTWDIETYTSGIQTGADPDPKDPNIKIFMICGTLHWQYENEALVKFCLVDLPTEATENVFYSENEVRSGLNYMICCGNEKGILTAFCQILKKLSPDIMAAFNGGGFDWPMCREKMYNHKLLIFLKESISNMRVSLTGEFMSTNESIYKKDFQVKKVKITNEHDEKPLILKIPGIIDTDVMVVFKCLYPRSEISNKGSLNFFLTKNNLSGKEDLKYTEMFKIYERALNCGFYDIEARNTSIKEMGLVAKYCIVDALRCQNLYVKRNIINDKRELANMSYVSIYGAFFHANGGKVVNIVGSHCNIDNILFSNGSINKRTVKYPGAFVFSPKLGPLRKRPVVGLDYESLYPNIIITYNFTPEKSIEYVNEDTLKYIQLLKDTGYDLLEVNFTSHINEKDAPDNGTPVKTRGWFIRHNNVLKDGDMTSTHKNGIIRDALPGEKMGIFPKVLLLLLNKRRALKAKLKVLSTLTEKMNVIISNNIRDGKQKYDFSKVNNNDLKDTGFSKVNLDYSEVIFRQTSINTKQSALKIIMNTFYGQQGSSNSSLYKLLVAGSIPLFGQINLKMVADYLEKLSYNIYYGDTDSVYISAPDVIFDIIDKIYDKYSNIIIELSNVDYDKKNIEDFNILNDERKSVTSLYTEYKVSYNNDNENLNTALNKKDITLAVYIKEREQNANKYYDIIINKTLEEINKNDLKINPQHIWYIVYYIIKEDYWQILSQITRYDINELKINVNNYTAADNGTKYLTMAYEEVLFPVMFVAKKKYFGFAHVNKENFHPSLKDIFIKGIDIIKQGQSEFVKKIGIEVIYQICDIENNKQPLDIVKDKIREMCNKKWDLSYFVLCAKYKPAKDNKAVQKFVARMRKQYYLYSNTNSNEYNLYKAELYRIPEPNDPFEYVVVHKETEYDVGGRIIKNNIGDKMEYLRVFNALLETKDEMRIDFDYYMKGALNGILARFICYTPFFRPNVANVDYDILDSESYKNGCSFIKEYILQIQGYDATKRKIIGEEYQQISRNVHKKYYTVISEKYGIAGKSIIFDCNQFDTKSITPTDVKLNTLDLTDMCENNIKALELYAEGITVNFNSDLSKKFYNRCIRHLTDKKQIREYLYVLIKYYKNSKTFPNPRIKYIEQKIIDTRGAIRHTYIRNINKLYKQTNNGIIQDIFNIRNNQNNIDNINIEIDETQEKYIYEMYNLILRLSALYSNKIKLEQIYKYLKFIKNKATGILIKPDLDINQLVNSSCYEQKYFDETI